MPWCDVCKREVTLPCVKCRTLSWMKSRKIEVSIRDDNDQRINKENAAVGDPCSKCEGVIELSTRTRDGGGVPSDHFRCSKRCGLKFSREADRPKGKPNRGGHV